LLMYPTWTQGLVALSPDSDTLLFRSMKLGE
jgi:hypothetical protein